MGRNVRIVLAVVTAVVMAGCTADVGRGGVSPHSAAPRPPAVTSLLPPGGEAAAVLAELLVAEPDHRGDYDRELFGQRWSDDVDVDGGRNGCDTRNDILRRDLAVTVSKPGTRDCVIASGTLVDPYTGKAIEFVRGPSSDLVQIDHVVALSDAWAKGARELDPQRRQDLANDPLNLLAVDGEANQAKGNADAAGWLPPESSSHCSYVARQIAVKDRYNLWITPAELAAMGTVLHHCPRQALPTG